MKGLVLTLFIFYTAACAVGQDQRSLDLIGAHPVGSKKEISTLNTTAPIKSRRHNIAARYNPFALTATGLMLFYQHVVSPQISSSCIYTRSCSNFAKEAITEFGLIRGVLLAADRLLRCNRSCENDYPAYAFAPSGRIIDEPSIYRKHK
jgi:putative component of membrane protein insertase Oxa1/YidC/SpoIIIJ protein YidD